jgi:hypothetical protein
VRVCAFLTTLKSVFKLFIPQTQGWCFSTPSVDLGLFYLPLWIIWGLNIYFYLSARSHLRRILDVYLTTPSATVHQVHCPGKSSRESAPIQSTRLPKEEIKEIVEQFSCYS